MRHRNTDPGEGCITSVELTFQTANHLDCELDIKASGPLTPEGYLTIETIRFTAGESCPNYPGSVKGRYVADDMEGSGIEILGGASGDKTYGCYKAGMYLRLNGTLRNTFDDTGAQTLTMSDNAIRVMGQLSSIGDEDTDCPL